MNRIDVEWLIAMLQDLERMSKEEPAEARQALHHVLESVVAAPWKKAEGSPTTNST